MNAHQRAQGARTQSFTDEWNAREAELSNWRDEMDPPAGSQPFEPPPDPETSAVLYGQSAGFVKAIRPAADVLRTISEDAERILRSRPTAILT